MVINRDKLVNWTLFIALSFIWGSSFILMKEGMKTLTAYQVASIRLLSAGLVLMPMALIQVRKIPYSKLGYIVTSGLLGSFLPAFLFCIAETRIDSSLAGFLNALTPIFTILMGWLFFKLATPRHKILGVFIGLAGMLLIFLANGTANLTDFSYASLVLLATLFYGINILLVNRHLREIGSVNIAAFAFTLLAVPAVTVLWVTGYFSMPGTTAKWVATGYSSLLGVMGTAVATILFYVLLKRAGALFASMVTYGIPFVALIWGIVAGEYITLWQVLGLGVLLAGVYTANK